MTDDELARVKNGRLAGFFYALENIGGFGGVADRLNAYNVYLGDPGRITSDFERLPGGHARGGPRGGPAVSWSGARAWLSPSSAARVRPGAVRSRPGARPLGRPAERRRPRRSGPRGPRSAPSRCGLPLWVIPRRDLPIVAATLVLGGGASRQPAGIRAAWPN